MKEIHLKASLWSDLKDHLRKWLYFSSTLIGWFCKYRCYQTNMHGVIFGASVLPSR